MIYSEKHKNPPSILSVAWIVILFVVVTAYGAIALNTGDWLWFYPRFNNRPSQIVLHCYGEDLVVDPFTQGFSDITRLVNDSLSGTKRWDPLSLSEATYQDYQTHPGMMTLELHYPQAVRIHSSTIYFSNVDTLIIPLDGRHASLGAIFGRTKAGDPAAGSLIVENTPQIARHLDAAGLCEAPAESEPAESN
jgi:hypothetical protein